MKLFSKKLLTILLGMLILLLEASCNVQSPKSPGVKAPADPNVVAKIGDNVIMKEELKKRLLRELYPKEYEIFDEKAKPADAHSVLMTMIAEKAMIADARTQGYSQDDAISGSVKRFRERRLINLLLQNYIQNKKDEIIATESEIDQRVQADPNINRTRVRRIIENQKARKIIDQYYNQLYEKFHTKKLSENYTKAVQIHERLLNHPKTPQKLKYIRSTQIKDEMTPEEKNIVLATYDYGKVTMEDWFKALCEFSPPNRPKNLGTTKGVEQFLNRALAMPLYTAEAKLLKLNEDKNLLKQVRDYEERHLLGKVNREILKDINEPSAEQLAAYYNNNKEKFRIDKFVKIDAIWCPDLKTANQVKAELDSDKDFESVKQKYSLEKKIKPFNAYPNREGLFWKQIWQAEPNDIVGPIKGFHRQGIKWRVVKILEKNPGIIKEYSTNMDNRIKNAIMSEKRLTLLSKHRSKMLKKYPYEIYNERIKDIDPMDIP